MNKRFAVVLLGMAAAACPVWPADPSPSRPKAGKVEIMPVSEVKAGMKATAWTVFQGTEPEAVPVEIIGLAKNMWGPKQDIILGKMGGKAARTNVAKGMSGSPVYINGKLIGAVSLGLSQFSPDAICGITPIELMLEINGSDKSRPIDVRAPGKAVAQNSSGDSALEALMPIESPLVFSGLNGDTLHEFSSIFQQMGVRTVQGAGGTSTHGSKPVTGWEHALNPGDSVATILVDGDMGISAFGTVTYNDGKRVLAFGHPLFNLGPVDMPLAKSEVVLTLASQFQPSKMANATGVVGALRQDRHSGIMGELGETSPMIPVTLKIRSLDEKEAVRSEKDFHFNVFVHQKWTPTLMMLTLYNSIQNLNEFVDEATYRLKGKVEMNGPSNISLATMQATGDLPMPAPMALALWLGDKFNRLYGNNVNPPDVKGVTMSLDLLPERRVATIESAWVATADVQAGDEVPVKISLRPYRGEAIQREVKVKIPAGLGKGDHRILLSDADTLNRMQSAAGFMNRFIDQPQTVSLLNQERSNNRLYVSLVQSSPTAYYDDKTLPSLPSSVLNVMQAGRASNRSMVTTPETASEQMSIPFDYMVTGSYSLRIHVK
uniref:Peptidase S55 domain-containing protein n=1 Tax=Solibacter usitatus (strain Ellin6076) TaxID=234267 RepID=Q01QH5_SOLUE